MGPSETTVNPAPEDLARKLRSAIASGDHFAARQLAESYVAGLRTLWNALPESSRACSTLPGEARELLSWAREAAIIQRALMSDQLATLRKASRYQFQAPPTGSSLVL